MTLRPISPLAIAAVLLVSCAAALSATAPKATRTSFSASARQVTDGESVTLKATVVALRAEDGAPGGSVEFFDGATSLGTAELTASDDGPAAQLTLTLGVGPHPITVQYPGDASFGGSVSVPEFVLVIGR